MGELFEEEELLKLEENSLFSDSPVTVLGKEFKNDAERKEYFREELRKKLPELKKLEGYPIGEDEDILNLSDPPFYTACPNPWLNDFIAEWENEKKELEKKGKRNKEFEVKTPYASDIKEGKNNPIYNAHSYHTKVPHPAIMQYILHYTQPGDIVFDGFAGTGMTGVASTMCAHPDIDLKNNINEDFKRNGYSKPVWGKRNSICTDLSPIASFISSNYNSKVDVIKFNKDTQKVINTIKKECEWMYKTKHTDGSYGKINYIVWADNYICNNCGKTFNYYEATVKKIGQVVETSKQLTCPYCNASFEHKELNKKFITEVDNSNGNINRIVEETPVLINYSDKNGKGRFEKKPDKEDYEILKKINDLSFDWYPSNELYNGFNLQQPQKSHNIQTVNLFYEKRTLYILSKINSLTKKNAPLHFIFTSMLPKLTKLNRYMPQHGSRALVGPMTNTLYLSPMHVENQVISQFEFQFKKIEKAFYLTNKSITCIESATYNFLPDNSIDYIFVDPPFGANIMYSDLNFLPESWLKIRTNSKEEAIKNDYQNKNIYDYINLMTASFKNFYSYLKPGKWMTVEFSNTSNAVWNGIRTAINKAGFIISSISAIDKERPGLFGMTTTTAVNEDLILSCYKPSTKLQYNFYESKNIEDIWNFVTDYLEHLPFPIIKEEKAFVVTERNPKIIYDKLIKYFLMANIVIPIDANEFQENLAKRYYSEDGMFFTKEQITQYRNLKIKNKINNAQGLLNFDLIEDEKSAISWLTYKLQYKPLTYQDLQPDYRKAYTLIKKGEKQIELLDILEENFIQENNGEWRLPNLREQKDIDILKEKTLLKLWKDYCLKIDSGKVKKLKDVRLEAIKAGFKDCYKNKDFKRIVDIGNKIPENLLTEDETLLNYYDIASNKI